MTTSFEHTPFDYTLGQWLLGEADDGFYVSDGRLPDVAQKIPRLADARLIAAAPRLLKVVEGFKSKLTTYVGVYPGDKQLRKLLADCEEAISEASWGAQQ